MSLKYGLNIKKAGAIAPARRTLLDDDKEDDDDDDDDDLDSGPGGAGAAEEITSLGGENLKSPLSISRSSKAPSRAAKPSSGPPVRKKPFLEPDHSDEDENNPAASHNLQDLSSTYAARAQISAAETHDASIFDYDSFHDAKSAVQAAHQAAAKQDAIERKPKYIDSLLDAAAQRKQDQAIAREKVLQREREAEGDEFQDKEKFVTGAYKMQQEENRRLEEEERKKVDLEEKRKRMMGGGGSGMQGFYRGMMDARERQHQEAIEAAAKIEREGGVNVGEGKKEKTDADRAAELRAQGVNVHLNDEGQVTDKRELLAAGLNLAPSVKAKDGRDADAAARASNRAPHLAFAARLDGGGGRQAQRERQTRMMEEQIAAQAKRARDEEAEERARMERAAKSSKTSQDVSDAKARYLARKVAKEKGEG